MKKFLTKTFCSNITKNKSHTPFIYGKGTENTLNKSIQKKYDAIIVGAGHNGLICANYLAKEGKKVLVLEKRHVVGGCAVTEELFEGYKFSRCSYVLSLFRKKIIDEIFPDFQEKVKLLKRNPKGFTPTKEEGVYLVRRAERDLLKQEIAKFSKKDAERIGEFDDFLTRMVKIVDPLIDMAPPEKFSLFDRNVQQLIVHAFKHRNDLLEFYHFLTSSAEYYLDKYLESDILKGTFATDAVIGAMKSPKSTGSAYVLLHHVMGNLDLEGNWYYVQGGNGALSNYIADSAVAKGVTVSLSNPVQKLTIDEKAKAVKGVVCESGHEIEAGTVVSACDLYTTYLKLMDKKQREAVLPGNLIQSLEMIDYTSPVMKINLAVNKLPEFKCLSSLPSKYNGDYHKMALDHLTGTIHMNAESINDIDVAYCEALSGKPSTKPIIEMTIPSLLDSTLTPSGSGHHVIGLFCQYAPNKLNTGSWNSQRKKDFAKKIYDEIDKYAPGFSKSILYEDILSPADLEAEFSIRGGNIFHGAMDLSTIFLCRPSLGLASYRQPVKNLFTCSAAMHPGGGVMGAPGRNCAFTILNKRL